MKKILTQYGVCALVIALMVPLAQAQAQPAGMQAAFGKDAGTLSDKFTGLARVMSGKYDWKPAQGVRSVGDVFNLVVVENGMLVGVLVALGVLGAIALLVVLFLQRGRDVAPDRLLLAGDALDGEKTHEPRDGGLGVDGHEVGFLR